MKIEKILSFFPIRVAITDHCNLRCFFCSNEGLPLSQKNKSHINVKQLEYLIKSMHEAGLKNISLTGGDPTLHPMITEIIDFINLYDFKNVFLHTNGINLSKKLIKKLGNKFTKIAVSVHSVNPGTWKKMTNGTEGQFKKLLSNLKIISRLRGKTLVELKFVPIKGYNDSKKEITNFLDFCNFLKFNFKILNFEPITEDQIKLSIPFKKIEEKLLSIGCKREPSERKFRGQSIYLPVKKFKYKNIYGVAIEIGCGNKKACEECYHSNEIFISPELKIKPCHADSYQIDISNFIKEKRNKAILNAIMRSREFLAQSPGIGAKTWRDNKVK